MPAMNRLDWVDKPFTGWKRIDDVAIEPIKSGRLG